MRLPIKVDGGRHIEAVQELTDGRGAEAIIEFVGENGAIEDGVAMIQDGGFFYVIRYGQNIDIPTIDVMADLDQGRLQGRGILVPAGA